MSYGSISQEAHETLAIAMNRLGAKSNTGEGGEDADRLHDTERRSSIKQVASGRFGVTAEYLTNSDDIQIKMAQGAKPGEGGQLPGHKVYPWIAKTRYSTPGVGLISPPPHHDIYSIEDLAQLIHDLKNANPRARIHVKLVSEVGVGTVAAGVSKAHADVVLISGHDGGTGASPLTSLKHAGGPVGARPGRDPADPAAQRPARPDRRPDRRPAEDRPRRGDRGAARRRGVRLRDRAAGRVGLHHDAGLPPRHLPGRRRHPEPRPAGALHRQGRARRRTSSSTSPRRSASCWRELGFRTLDEAIGRVDALDVTRAVDHWKAVGPRPGADPAPARSSPRARPGTTPPAQDHGLDKSLDVNELVPLAEPALERGEPVRAQLTVRNVNRTVGTILGHEVTKRYSGEGLPDGTIDITFTGSAGQSFGAFLPAGITLRLEGDANDYVGKGLSGGRIVIRPDRAATFEASEQIIAGNVICYGATSGRDLPARRGGGAVLRPQLRRHWPSSRASATTAAST